MPPEYKYFTAEEVEGLDGEFVAKLDMATAKTAEFGERRIPFVITSGLRTPEKNLSVVGAVPDSAHLKGLAVDLRVETSHDVWVIVAALSAVGIKRVGIYVNLQNEPTHIHCDVDPEKVDKVIFIKREGQSSPVATA